MKRMVAVLVAVAASGLLWGGAGTALAAAPTGSGPGGPLLRAAASSPGLPVVSINWSGYAVTSPSKFTYVHSQFVQPAIKCPGVTSQWTSNWVGLDGFDNQTVEQDGTFAHCGGPNSTTPVYKAWYEMFPANSINVFPVKAGDVIDASVAYTAGQFTLTVADLTSGRTASHVATCASCQRASAEWIIERPATCNRAQTKCSLTELADFGTAVMSNNIAAAGKVTTGIAGFPSNYAILMFGPIKKGLIQLDTVSPVHKATYGFTGTWYRSGTTVPLS